MCVYRKEEGKREGRKEEGRRGGKISFLRTHQNSCPTPLTTPTWHFPYRTWCSMLLVLSTSEELVLTQHGGRANPRATTACYVHNADKGDDC